MCFCVFSEVTDPKWRIWDVLWLMVTAFDHMWVPLVALFQIFEPNVT